MGGSFPQRVTMTVCLGFCVNPSSMHGTVLGDPYSKKNLVYVVSILIIILLYYLFSLKNIIWEHSPRETMYIVSITKHVVWVLHDHSKRCWNWTWVFCFVTGDWLRPMLSKCLWLQEIMINCFLIVYWFTQYRKNYTIQNFRTTIFYLRCTFTW